uniref:Tensin 2b n=1 Tax=Denticeps clupeoides TaxID=299321 RepID=A0AAY4EH90_9TELE
HHCSPPVSVSPLTADLKQAELLSWKKTGLIKTGFPHSESVERVMDVVMERHYDFDLTYITERIICVFFLLDLDEERYHNNIKEVAAMLKSRHQDKFLLLNLSEKRHDISRLNPKVQDFGWPDLHAPPLDKICAMCKAMESWLTSDPQHVVVLHCKGNKGKTGVIIAAYMHYSKISAGADQALSTVAMRKFCEDKISHSLQPSQNRYIYYFGGLLSGSIKLNSNALFLHQVLIPTLPNFQSGGGYSPFLKIYQSLQLVYTSGIYDVQASRGRRVCVTLEPALQLKGDVMVKCYHRHAHGFERECVFRVQFHTCTVHGAQLWFGKEELDKACKDDRFPSDAKVEFVFSYRPETIKGTQTLTNDPGVTVDYGTSDPVVRWDSYENFNLHHQDSTEDISHTRGPLDGSLYAQVKKRRPPAQPPSQAQPQSSNRDLGNSLQPSGLQEEKSPKPPPKTCRERVELEFRPAREKTRSQENDRETAILDDGETSPRRPERHSCCARPYSPRALYDPAYLPSGIYVGSCDLEDSTCGDLRAHSPVPDGCATPSFPLASYYYSLLTVPHVPYTGYTAITIPTTPPQPPLPEKRRPPNTTGSPSRTSTPTASTGCPSGGSSTSSSVSQLHVTFSPTVSERPASPHHKAAVAGAGELSEPRVTAKFVQDSSKFWYKPGISRDQAIAVLKGKEPGSFLIRDSNSFHGAYGLALRVATPPPSINNHGNKGDPLEHLVRHFLIESGPRGVKIKGCQNETYFGSLSALVYQHSITPISLPCALVIPEKDLVGELQELQGGTNTSTASDLLKQGAACNVLYLNSVETESLTGPQAISKATRCTLTQEPHPTGTVVHFKVSAQGITLTDSQRKVFFRRHYPISSVTFSCVDPQDRRWVIFGFVAKRPGSASENVCHLFAELDPEQPATAIVNFINKVMLGPHLRR